MTDKTSPTNKLDLPDALEVYISHKEFRYPYTYTASISTTFPGYVSGGGTKVGYHVNKGFTIRVKNNETRERSYNFRLTQFKNRETKLINNHNSLQSNMLGPGYSQELDIELSDEVSPYGLDLEHIYVSDINHSVVRSYNPNCAMGEIADRDPKFIADQAERKKWIWRTRTGFLFLLSVPAIAQILLSIFSSIDHTLFELNRQKTMDKQKSFDAQAEIEEKIIKEAPSTVYDILAKTPSEELAQYSNDKKTPKLSFQDGVVFEFLINKFLFGQANHIMSWYDENLIKTELKNLGIDISNVKSSFQVKVSPHYLKDSFPNSVDTLGKAPCRVGAVECIICDVASKGGSVQRKVFLYVPNEKTRIKLQHAPNSEMFIKLYQECLRSAQKDVQKTRKEILKQTSIHKQSYHAAHAMLTRKNGQYSQPIRNNCNVSAQQGDRYPKRHG
jgi:hypothetical protein